MPILAISWVVLAATAVVLATMRKTPLADEDNTSGSKRESGRALTALALIYGMALLAGFIYVSKLLVSNL